MISETGVDDAVSPVPMLARVEPMACRMVTAVVGEVVVPSTGAGEDRESDGARELQVAIWRVSQAKLLFDRSAADISSWIASFCTICTLRLEAP